MTTHYHTAVPVSNLTAARTNINERLGDLDEQIYDFANGNDLSYPAVPTFSGYVDFGAGQSVSSASAYTINWNTGGTITKRYSAGMWSSSNPTRVVIPTTGYYRVFGHAYWQAGTNVRQTQAMKNGAALGAGDYDYVSTSSLHAATFLESSHALYTAGDYIEIRMLQYSGGALLLYHAKFTVAWEG